MASRLDDIDWPIRTERLTLRRGDMDDLDAKLAEAHAAGARFKLIATDGVFSMDGIVADLASICNLADRHHARLAGQPLDIRERRLVGVRGLVGMDADRGPHVGLAGGHRRGCARGRHVRTDREDAPDAYRPRTLEHGIEVARELLEREAEADRPLYEDVSRRGV